MHKDRTKHQDFKLVKEWITAVNPKSVIQILQKENIDIRYFKKAYTRFFLSNYRAKTRGHETIRKVTRLIVEKKLYGYNTNEYFYDKELDNTSEKFRNNTIEQAIEKFFEVRKESQNLIDGIDKFYKTKMMNTGEFNRFCWRYGLDSLKEKNIKTKNEEYRLKAYIRKANGEARPKKKKTIDKSEEKQRQFYFLKNLSKLHYTGRTYTQENLAELRKYGFTGYQEEMILNKIQELQSSIQ